MLYTPVSGHLVALAPMALVTMAILTCLLTPPPPTPPAAPRKSVVKGREGLQGEEAHQMHALPKDSTMLKSQHRSEVLISYCLLSLITVIGDSRVTCSLIGFLSTRRSQF